MGKTCGKPGLFWKKLAGNCPEKPWPVSLETLSQGNAHHACARPTAPSLGPPSLVYLGVLRPHIPRRPQLLCASHAALGSVHCSQAGPSGPPALPGVSDRIRSPPSSYASSPSSSSSLSSWSPASSAASSDGQLSSAPSPRPASWPGNACSRSARTPMRGRHRLQTKPHATPRSDGPHCYRRATALFSALPRY